MSGQTNFGRVTIVALSMAWLGERVVVRGVAPDTTSAQLAATLRADGIAAEVFSATGPRTVRGVARAVAARAPETIVAHIRGEISAALARIWIGALRAESPDAWIVLVSDGVAPAGLDVDARALAGDDAIAELVRALRCTRAPAPGRPAPTVNRRVLDATGGAAGRRHGPIAIGWG